jgi:hypothetical protein
LVYDLFWGNGQQKEADRIKLPPVVLGWRLFNGSFFQFKASIPDANVDYKDLQFLHAAFLLDQPYVLHKGETLELNYTFYIHDGKADSNILDTIWRKVCK